MLMKRLFQHPIRKVRCTLMDGDVASRNEQLGNPHGVWNRRRAMRLISPSSATPVHTRWTGDIEGKTTACRARYIALSTMHSAHGMHLKGSVLHERFHQAADERPTILVARTPLGCNHLLHLFKSCGNHSILHLRKHMLWLQLVPCGIPLQGIQTFHRPWIAIAYTVETEALISRNMDAVGFASLFDGSSCVAGTLHPREPCS